MVSPARRTPPLDRSNKFSLMQIHLSQTIRRRALVHTAWQVKIEFAALLAAGLTLLQRALQMNHSDILMDDAYISFRYAMNFANGLGLVFNPGERVEGYTNFLWTVIIAACARLGLNIITASKVILALSAIATLILIFIIARRIFAGKRLQAFLVSIPVLLFAVMGYQARYIVSGMETHLFVFLILLAVALFLFGSRPFLAGLVFALAAMTRPEGVFYFALALGFAALLWLIAHLPEIRPLSDLRRFYPQVDPIPSNLDRRYASNLPSILFFAAGFALIYGGYFLWRYHYYGFLAPNTYYAKAAGFYWSRVLRGWDYLRTLLSQSALLPVLALALLGLLSLRRSRIWALMLLFIITTLAYFLYVGGDFIVWFGPRFLMPVVPFLLFMSMEGIDRMTQLFRSRERFKVAVQAILCAALIVYTLVYSWPWTLKLESFTTQMRGWTELGKWIAANTSPQTTIATDAAGLIPYYSQRYAIDMFGLTDTHIAHLNNPVLAEGIVAHEKYDPRYVLGRNPECIVSTWMDAQGHALSAGLLQIQNTFSDRYHLVAVAKIRGGPAQNERWVISTRDYSQELYDAGYVSGLFCRINLSQP